MMRLTKHRPSYYYGTQRTVTIWLAMEYPVVSSPTIKVRAAIMATRPMNSSVSQRNFSFCCSGIEGECRGKSHLFGMTSVGWTDNGNDTATIISSSSQPVLKARVLGSIFDVTSRRSHRRRPSRRRAPIAGFQAFTALAMEARRIREVLLIRCMIVAALESGFRKDTTLEMCRKSKRWKNVMPGSFNG